MENKTLTKMKLLIAAALVLFFAGVVVDMVSGGARDFKRGFDAVEKEGASEDKGKAVEVFWVAVEPLAPDAHAVELADGATFTSLSTDGELVVPVRNLPKRSGWVAAANIVTIIVASVALIAFVVSVIVFAVKFPRRKILDPANVRSLRWIAASLGATMLAYYGIMLDEHALLGDLVRRSGYRMEFPKFPTELIVAAIVWVVAEIMNLAGRLQNEQELTI